MNSEHDHLTSLADLCLTPEEKGQIKSHLMAYAVSYAPRPAWASFIFRHGIATAFASVLLLAGTSTVLADRSLPGDLFYPLKVSVNDRVAVAIAGDEDSKLDTALSQIERMLREEEEAARHEFDGELSDEQQDLPEPSEAVSEDTQHRGSDDQEEDTEDDQQDDEHSQQDAAGDDQEWLNQINDELHSLKAEIENAAEDQVPEE